ncbi:hypothetical protein RUM44_009419 [Polyplax serrata]|uniref:valine--tRNA ligase n=1 Tax=Polyplax serrata TaxID=468196 RepID=A0ABR1AUC0_POLSC
MYKIIRKNPPTRVNLSILRLQTSCATTVLRISTTPETVDRKEVSSGALDVKYNSKVVESIWYDWWEKKNYFKPTKPDKDSFVVLLPPPNVTGVLHLGHVLAIALQDATLRWRRMKGESVLWVPGLDHAGIATQVAVEKYLEQTLGSSRHDLGREEFIKKVWEWKQEKGAKICGQLKSTGASLDWSRLKFTLDPDHSHLVAESFIKLYNNGLIYRNKALVNWSCTLKSSISDIEINWLNIHKKTFISVPEYEKPVKFGVIYEIAYKICGEDDEISIQTTRPETLLGDVAIAIHPDDPRYFKYKGKMVWHPFRQEKIPIISDNFVDPNKGSGVVKITPSHSLIDYEVAQKHNLPLIDVINEDGLINRVGVCEKLYNLKRFDARDVTLNELQNLGLFRGEYTYSTVVPICSRSGDVIEQIMKSQWFLKCEHLQKEALNAVNNGELKLVPPNYINVWKKFLLNSRDWNLSRQLWWGHKIPMYMCTSGDKTVWVGALSSDEAKIKGSEILQEAKDSINVTQDPDVLDTWFSSALLPLNTLSEPNSNFGDKPPISLMVTGHDILFFWVARMVMLTKQLTGKLPFNEVLLHSLVFDPKGRKMSKSLGNSIKPEDVINGRTLKEMVSELKENFSRGLIADKNLENLINEQKKMFPNGIPECGADALRFTLCSGNVLSANINFDLEMCLSATRFCNKIWQATKYLIKIVDNFMVSGNCDFQNSSLKNENLNHFDKWILSKLASTVKLVDESLSTYKFSVATTNTKHFFVEDFCSIYLEGCKSRMNNPIEAKKIILVTYKCLETCLKLLSPFMPFVTEHLYQALPELGGIEKAESITISKFPNPEEWLPFCDSELEKKFTSVLSLISTLFRIKTTYRLPPNTSNAFVKCPVDIVDILFGELSGTLATLGKMKSLNRMNGHNGMNVIEATLGDDFIIYVEHQHNKDTLHKYLDSAISKEAKLRGDLQKLNEQMEGNNWEEMSPLEKSRCKSKLLNTKDALKSIKEFKNAIEKCTT